MLKIDQFDPKIGGADAHLLAWFQGKRSAVHAQQKQRIPPSCNEGDFTFKWNDQRAIIQIVRRNRGHDNHVRPRQDNGASSTERISCRSRWSAHQQTVSPVRIDECPVAVNVHNHHARGVSLVDHHFVQCEGKLAEVLAFNLNVQQRPFLFPSFASHQSIHGQIKRLHAHVAQEAEATSVHSQNGNAPLTHHRSRLQHGSIPPKR